MKKYITYILVATSLVSVSGCKDYLNINTNPNQLTVTKPDFILSGALVQSANIKLGADAQNYAGQWSGYYAASGSYSQSGDRIRTYGLTNADGNAPFNDIFLNMSNYNYVEQHVATLKGYDDYIAICEIMKAYWFATLIDTYGNVPYTQALTGFTFLYPKYDKAEDIYKSLSLKLDSAISIIDNAKDPVAVPKTTDVMFSGDMTKWKAFANTVNLRLLIHQSAVVDVTFVNTEIAKIVANGGGYLTTDAVIQPGYTAAQNLQSPLWENYGQSYSGPIGGRDYIRPSAFFLASMNTLQDPRLLYLLRAPNSAPGTQATNTTSFKAVGFGDLPATANNSANTSGWGPGLVRAATQGAIFFNAGQTYFLLAEATLNGWIPGGDAQTQTYYEAGVKASFETDFNAPAATADAAAATYVTSGVVNADFSVAKTPDTKLRTILVQKWIADWGLDAIEAWDDTRRNNAFGATIPLSNDPTKLSDAKWNPVRFLIPQTEYNNNPNNAKNEGQQDLTEAQLTEFIFWDPAN